MKASETEIQILQALLGCRYLPGSFDKKFPRQIDVNNISPRQQYWIYRLGYKYRKQIRNDAIETICRMYLNSTPEPLTRRQAEKLAKGKKEVAPVKFNRVKEESRKSLDANQLNIFNHYQ